MVACEVGTLVCLLPRFDGMTDFREMIKQRIDALEAMAEGSRAAAEVVELDQTRQGRLSRMDALQGQAMAKESEQRRVMALRRLKAALSRLEAGDFGVCQDCGEDIAKARLSADPACTLCVECASAQEHDRPAR